MSWFFSKSGGPASTLLTSLAEYWNLDEASGNRFGDVNTTQFTENNGPIGTATGPDGVALCPTFVKASSQFLRNDTGPIAIPTTSFSFFLWARFGSSNASVVNTLLSKWDSSNREVLLNEYNGDINLQVGLTLTSSGTTLVVGGISINTWYSVYMAFDSALSEIQLSVNDGTLATTAQATKSPTGAEHLQLGRNPGASHYMDGRLARLGFWNRVLTPTERTYLHNSGAGKAYPF